TPRQGAACRDRVSAASQAFAASGRSAVDRRVGYLARAVTSPRGRGRSWASGGVRQTGRSPLCNPPVIHGKEPVARLAKGVGLLGHDLLRHDAHLRWPVANAVGVTAKPLVGLADLANVGFKPLVGEQ